jgi:hypothetical protein
MAYFGSKRGAAVPEGLAARNRAIKKLLEAEYGKGKVSVRDASSTRRPLYSVQGSVVVSIAAPVPNSAAYLETHDRLIRQILDAGIELAYADHDNDGRKLPERFYFLQLQFTGPD